ncbi:MAG: response regulator transcription factor [Acutalibacteraceae bacterium]
MIKKYILVIEGEKILNSMICEICKNAGYQVKSASDYSDCAEQLLLDSNRISLFILDLEAQGDFEENIITSVRNKTDIPILCISRENTFSAKASALNLGADDFLSIPFDVSEFLARVNSILRRYKISSASEYLKFKDIMLDTKRHVVLVNNSHIDLTLKEYEILRLLMQNPLEIISKEEIYNSIWDNEFFQCDKILNTHIYNLRKKLNLSGDKEKYIHTVWGRGYRLSID